MKFLALIPARYASMRFPGKPLAMLGGKPVIARVIEQVRKAIPDAVVATDDERIAAVVKEYGGRAVMTRADHRSGTDRLEEAMQHLEAEGVQADVIINVQGDEPFIQPEQIQALCQCFDNPDTDIATLGVPFGDDIAAIRNPNSPKIAISRQGYALYFSRSVIPYCRGKQEEEWPQCFPFVKHIGLYAYRRQVLHAVTQLPQSPLETAESLEQLRWLEAGYRIRVALTTVQTIGIDTPADLEKAEALISVAACDSV